MKKYNIINKIKRYFKPIYSQIEIVNSDKQEIEIKCYRNENYTHTVIIHYFTKKQIERFQNHIK